MKVALSDRAISALSPADTGKRYDVKDTIVPGFLVRVTDSGSKTFALYARFQPGAGPTRRVVGEVGATTLKADRNIARDWRESIRRGVDPDEVLKQQAADHRRARDAEKNTFSKVAEFYLAERVIGPDPEKPILRGAEQVTRQFWHDLIPALGEKAIAAITAGQDLAFSSA
jgi:hypothetical protein